MTAGGERLIPERAGLLTYFQLKAWSSGYASWEEAYATGSPTVLVSRAAQSPIVLGWVTATSLEPTLGIPWGGTRENPIVVEVGPVPEPGVWVLAALGALGLWVVARFRGRPSG